jgi:hypothetical protein
MGLMNNLTPDAYRSWAQGLSDMTEAQLAYGVKKARDFTGYFNLPAFRELCRITAKDIGLPSAQDAMREACRAMAGRVEDYNWSHPAVYHAAMEIGRFELTNRTERELLPLFDSAYAQLVRRVLNGEDLTMPVSKALPKEVFVPATEEKAAEALSKMKSMFN